MTYLEPIQKAGFRLHLEDGKLLVEPFSRLSPKQRAFIRRHRAEIIAELTGDGGLEPRPSKTDPAEVFSQTSVGAVDDASLAAILTRACEGLDLKPQTLWRYLSREDIEAIRHDPDDEWYPLRGCAVIWAGMPPEIDGGHDLPFPGHQNGNLEDA